MIIADQSYNQINFKGPVPTIQEKKYSEGTFLKRWSTLLCSIISASKYTSFSSSISHGPMSFFFLKLAPAFCSMSSYQRLRCLPLLFNPSLLCYSFTALVFIVSIKRYFCEKGNILEFSNISGLSFFFCFQI